MRIPRRHFLATAAAATLAPSWGRANPYTLTAEPVLSQILTGEFRDYGVTPALGFNGSTPGPALRVRQGETLAVAFKNRSGAPTSLHWHGIRIANAMDGVPDLTQRRVADGDDFDYRFVAPDAGTYWYHAHNRSWEQVARGLYGPLIVEEVTPPDVDADIIVIVDDWRLAENAAFIEDFDAMFHFAHAGRLGNYARIIASQTAVRSGDRVRLRLINTANARIFPVDISGVEGRLVALDGMALRQPEALGTLTLAPAQRADVIADVTGKIEFCFQTGQGDYALGAIALNGTNPARGRAPIPALPAHGIDAPKGAPDLHRTLRIEGGAMGGQHSGDDLWSLGGVSGLGDAPWLRLERGTSVQISLINDTAFPHGIHLHGQHFFEMSEEGKAGALRDTSLVDARQRRDIFCTFDNPGKWLLHCHMLGHAARGMTTWIEVL